MLAGSAVTRYWQTFGAVPLIIEHIFNGSQSASSMQR